MFLLWGTGLLVIGLIGSTLSAPQIDKKCSHTLISRASGKFSAKLLAKLEETHKGNLAMSPFNTFVSLAMANYGAEGETTEQLRNLLFNVPEDELETCKYKFPSFLKQFDAENKKSQMEFFNAIFVDKSLPLKKSYEDLTRRVFNSTVKQLDFNHAQETAESINSASKTATGDHINEIITPSEIDSFTKMILINAAHFKGDWASQFNPNYTTDRPFFLDENCLINVPMMYQMGTYKFQAEVSGLNASFIVIPFEGEEYEMVIVLPNSTSGLSTVLTKLSKLNLDHILNGVTFSSLVEFICPTFAIDNMVQLIEPLKKLGVNEAFSSKANFSGISEDQLHIGKFIQKGFINVTETGTDAGAVNRADFDVNSLPRPDKVYATMRVDRPFAYFIRHRITGVQMISGYMKSPLSSSDESNKKRSLRCEWITDLAEHE